MPELTHDDDGFHEIHLSGKQLVFLFMATTVVSVVIFLCGVLVGRGVRAERGDGSEVAPAAATTAQPQTTADAGPPASEPPAPPDADELSYKRRLEGNTPAAEQLKKAEEPAPPAAAPPRADERPVESAPAANVPTSGRPGTWVIQVHALQNRAAAAAIVQRLIDKGYPAFMQNPAAGAPAIYRVHIGRYDDRREAEQVARRLEKEEQFKPDIRR